MDSLKAFADELRKMTKQGLLLRPFVCDGSPLDCDIFIVGSNRAAKLASEFWKYWDDSRGLDKARFLSEYGNYRRGRGKPEIAHSRNTLEVLMKSCAPLRCLETNVFGVTTDTRDEALAAPTQGISILPYLVETIKPRWIIAHGVVASSAVSVYDGRATIVKLPDLRKVAHSDVKRLGRRIVDSVLQERSGRHSGTAGELQQGNAVPESVTNVETGLQDIRLGDAIAMLGEGVAGDIDYRNSIVQAILAVARSRRDAALVAACEYVLENSCGVSGVTR